MPTLPEAPVGPVSERATRGAAFGLWLEIDPEIDILGIPASSAFDTAGANPPGVDSAATPSPLPTPSPLTRVRLDPPELERRWRLAAPISKVMRELRDDETVLLSVELAPLAGYLMRAPGFGRILISPDGSELICDPEPESSEWSALITAQALPLAATLRGFEVIHASGVVLGDSAALFTGRSGAGKSSLAAALLRRGAMLLSDDTVVLEPREGMLVAHPGAALLQLGAAEHGRLSPRERAVLGTPEASLDKQRYNLSATASPAPLGELFLLERSPQGPPLERIEAVDPFALLASTFNLSVRTPERLARHLDLAVALAAGERVYRLRVRPDMDATRLAEIVHEHLLEP
jgi:hypothetical protein